MLLTGLLQFFMSYTMALLAFWLLEVSTIIFILFAFEYIAGGHLFPLNILPPGLELALNCTPFPYLLYFPVSVYLGQARGAELWRGLAMQAGLGGPLLLRGAVGLAARHPHLLPPWEDERMNAKPFSQLQAAAPSRHLPRALAQFRRARDEFQKQFPPLARGRIPLVRPAVVFHRRDLSAHRPHRRLDQMAGLMLVGASHFIQQIFQAVFPDQLHPAFRTGPHRPPGFHAAAARQYAVPDFPAAGGPGRLRQRRLRPGASWPTPPAQLHLVPSAGADHLAFCSCARPGSSSITP